MYSMKKKKKSCNHRSLVSKPDPGQLMKFINVDVKDNMPAFSFSSHGIVEMCI